MTKFPPIGVHGSFFSFRVGSATFCPEQKCADKVGERDNGRDRKGKETFGRTEEQTNERGKVDEKW